jgi:signal peptidase I
MRQTLHTLLRDHKRFLLFVMLMLLFRTSLADWNTVPTGSMKPTILEGDRIWVNKLAYDIRVPLTRLSLKHLADPERGDIIVFDSTSAHKRLVKRVIGLPGDTIYMQDNRLSINGRLLPYRLESSGDGVLAMRESLGDKDHLIWIDSHRAGRLSSFPPVTVPAGHYLVLGDNRDNSADSRVIGFVPRADIIGRARSVVLSLNYEHYYLPRPGRFFHSL